MSSDYCRFILIGMPVKKKARDSVDYDPLSLFHVTTGILYAPSPLLARRPEVAPHSPHRQSISYGTNHCPLTATSLKFVFKLGLAYSAAFQRIRNIFADALCRLLLLIDNLQGWLRVIQN